MISGISESCWSSPCLFMDANSAVFDCPASSCHRSFNDHSALNLMRHWNQDHCTLALPTNYRAPDSLIACCECNTFYETNRNHRCRTRRLRQEGIRNSSNGNSQQDGVEECKSGDHQAVPSDVNNNVIVCSSLIANDLG